MSEPNNPGPQHTDGQLDGCCGTCQKWRLRGGKIAQWAELPGNCEHHPKLWTRHDTPCDCAGYVKWDTSNAALRGGEAVPSNDVVVKEL